MSSSASIGSSAVRSRPSVREVVEVPPDSGPWLVLLGPVSILLTVLAVAYISHLSF